MRRRISPKSGIGQTTMSKIHIFQRFSSVENTVTNNTLQLIARIYKYSPEQASKLLTELTEAEVEIGLEIRQQERAGNAIPDGTLIQRSFKILIEAKVDAQVDHNQLLRHCQTFTDEAQQVLLLLTKQRVDGNSLNKLVAEITKLHPRVIFRNITYEDICKACEGLFERHEFEMLAIVEDFSEYCNDVGLFDRSKYLMRIVTCGASLTLNEKYGIYFHRTDRGYTKHRFEGIYADKRVQFLIDLDCGGAVFDVDLKGGNLSKVCVEGEDSSKYDEKIKSMIADAKALCGYDVATGHRFFCGQIAPTEFVKQSKGGLYGTRFVDLKNSIGAFTDLEDVASKLREKTWK